MPCCAAISLDLRRRSDEDRRDQSLLASLDGAGERRLFARVRHGGRDRLEVRHRSSSCSYFPVPVSRVMTCLLRLPGPCGVLPVPSLSGETSERWRADAVEKRLERRLVVLERHRRSATADRGQHPAEDRSKQGAEGEVQKLTTPVAVPLNSGGLASLITV